MKYTPDLLFFRLLVLCFSVFYQASATPAPVFETTTNFDGFTLSLAEAESSSLPSLSDDAIKVVVIGSSTAEGHGVDPEDSWVGRYRSYLQSINPGNEVINLAIGGLTTYNLLPDGSKTPVGYEVDSERNITQAISRHPDAILINLPSNDTWAGFGKNIQMTNFKTMYDLAQENGIPVWITTTQPRDHRLTNTRLQIQLAVRDAIKATYGAHALDFWTGVASSDNKINPALALGDGIHFNADGHKNLFQEVVDKQIYERAHDRNDLSTSGKNGLKYKYFEGGRMREVADVDESRSELKKTGTIANFNISPKQRKYYFGFEYEGYIEIKKAGTYTFYTTSDDGSALWMGSTQVVDNDGIHTAREKSGQIYLTAGLHPIKVIFFEHAQAETLQVEYAGPGISRREIPDNMLFLDGSGAVVDNPEVVNNPDVVGNASDTGDPGLHYKYYEGGRMREVADVDESKSTLKKQGTVANFDISAHQRQYYFGFAFEGYLEIRQAGTYTFYTTSDDGSALWMGSTQVVDNDGIHTAREKSGQIYLTAGLHPIKVIFFEHAQAETLQVEYAGPGISRREIPDNVLYQGNGNARLVGSGKTSVGEETVVDKVNHLDEKLQAVKVHAYPNPVIEVLNIELKGAKKEVATISVIDQLGRVVYSEQKTISGLAEHFELYLPALGLKTGFMFLQIEAPSYGKKTIRLLKK